MISIKAEPRFLSNIRESWSQIKKEELIEKLGDINKDDRTIRFLYYNDFKRSFGIKRQNSMDVDVFNHSEIVVITEFFVGDAKDYFGIHTTQSISESKIIDYLLDYDINNYISKVNNLIIKNENMINLVDFYEIPIELSGIKMSELLDRYNKFNIINSSLLGFSLLSFKDITYNKLENLYIDRGILLKAFSGISINTSNLKAENIFIDESSDDIVNELKLRLEAMNRLKMNNTPDYVNLKMILELVDKAEIITFSENEKQLVEDRYELSVY